MANDLQTALRTIAEYPVTDLSNLDAVNMRHIAQAALTSPVAPEQVVAVSAFQKALDIRIEQGWQLGGNACPVLYTDTINDQQVCRDDLWLATTAGLKGASPEAAPAAMEGLAKRIYEAVIEHYNSTYSWQSNVERLLPAATPAAPSAVFATTMRNIFGNEFPTHPNSAGEYPGWSDHLAIFQAGAALAQPAPVQAGAQQAIESDVCQVIYATLKPGQSNPHPFFYEEEQWKAEENAKEFGWRVLEYRLAAPTQAGAGDAKGGA